MNFKELLHRARHGDAKAVEQIVEMYKPMLLREAIIDGVFCEDLFQEFLLVLYTCIRKIKK